MKEECLGAARNITPECKSATRGVNPGCVVGCTVNFQHFHGGGSPPIPSFSLMIYLGNTYYDL